MVLLCKQLFVRVVFVTLEKRKKIENNNILSRNKNHSKIVMYTTRAK